MADHDGPWTSPPAPSPRRRRPLVAIGFVAAVGAVLIVLGRWFPDRLSSSTDWGRMAQPLGTLALASASLLSMRLKLSQIVRYASIWVGVAAILLLGYTFRQDMAEVGLRMRSELVPSYAVSTSPHSMVLTQGADGGYSVMGQINGQPTRFMVDTGASDIVLSPADARRAGVDISSLNFAGVYETANGMGHGAPFTVDRLSVGPMTLTGIPVSINQAPMSASLLGMSFLRRLDSFEIKDRRLYLKWRE